MLGDVCAADAVADALVGELDAGVAGRSDLPGQSCLSPAEHHLLMGWLDRLRAEAPIEIAGDQAKRGAVVAHEIEGLSFKEIAEETGVNVNTLLSRKRYAVLELRQRLAKYHRDVDVAFRGWNDAWLDPRFRAFDIADHVARIQAPVLALQGADDPYGTPEQLRVLERLASRQVETWLMPDARHSPQLEAKEATLAMIVPFVRKVLMKAAA